EYAGVRAGDKIVTEPLRFGRGTIAAFGRAGFRLGLQPRREAKRVLRYIIISDGRKLIAPRAGELFLGVEVLEHGADAGLAPLPRKLRGLVRRLERPMRQLDLARERAEPRMLFDDLAPHFVARLLDFELDLLLARSPLALAVPVQQTAGADSPA